MTVTGPDGQPTTTATATAADDDHGTDDDHDSPDDNRHHDGPDHHDHPAHNHLRQPPSRPPRSPRRRAADDHHRRAHDDRRRPGQPKRADMARPAPEERTDIPPAAHAAVAALIAAPTEPVKMSGGIGAGKSSVLGVRATLRTAGVMVGPARPCVGDRTMRRSS